MTLRNGSPRSDPLREIVQIPRHDPSTWRPPLVVLAGVGMARSDITAQTERWISQAEVLVGGRRVLEWFTDHPGIKISYQAAMDPVLDRAVELSAEKRVMVLASGDPLFFGVGRRLRQRLDLERLVVFPNVTAVQTLLVRIAQPWEDVQVFSLHGRSGSQWLEAIRTGSMVAILTDPQHSPAWIAQALSDAGIAGCSLVVGENLGNSDELVRFVGVDEARTMCFSPLNVVAILPDESDASTAVRSPCGAENHYAPVLGLPDDSFLHQAGLITKMEVRAVVLANLQLHPGLVLWDIGSGSGSVAIEAARLTKLQQVVAVEKDPERLQQLQKNIQQLGCGDLMAIHGAAPVVLRELADPDRVFIGGSGGELPAILDQVTLRLRPQGRVVQTLVTLETLTEVLAFWRRHGWDCSVTELQVNRSVPIGDMLRLEALNPVFIVSVLKI